MISERPDQSVPPSASEVDSTGSRLIAGLSSDAKGQKATVSLRWRQNHAGGSVHTLFPELHVCGRLSGDGRRVSQFGLAGCSRPVALPGTCCHRLLTLQQIAIRPIGKATRKTRTGSRLAIPSSNRELVAIARGHIVRRCCTLGTDSICSSKRWYSERTAAPRWVNSGPSHLRSTQHRGRHAADEPLSRDLNAQRDDTTGTFATT